MDRYNHLYNDIRGELGDMRIDKNGPLPSGKELKKESVKHFNVPNLRRQCFRYDKYEVDKIVTALDETLQELNNRLCDAPYRLHGRFLKVGSFIDGTKVRRVNEFDYLFVLDRDTIGEVVATKGSNNVTRKLKVGDREIIAHEYRSRLANAVNEIGETLRLGQGIRHGGFASPKFSGVRVNKPAVTLLFDWLNGSKEQSLTVDLTLALDVVNEEAAYRSHIQDILRPIAEHFPGYLETKGKLHFVPVCDDEWQVTSSHLETYLMERMHDMPVKKCIKLAKITSGFYMENIRVANEKFNTTRTISKVRELIENKLEEHSYCATTTEEGRTEQLRKELIQLLMYGHVVLTPDVIGSYRDFAKPITSLVSAAIKHQTFTEACSGNFNDVFNPDSNAEFDLLVSVFKKFGEMENCTVPNFFLPEEIKVVSVAPYALFEAPVMRHEVKCLCRRLSRRLSATKRYTAVKGFVTKNWILFLLLTVVIITVLTTHFH